MTGLSACEFKKSLCDFSKPTSESPSLNLPKNRFCFPLVGERDVIMPLTVALFSGDEISAGDSSQSGVAILNFSEDELVLRPL